MTDRNDAHPAEFDPVAAVFDEQLRTGGHRRDQIVDGATYAKMQAVIEAARGVMSAPRPAGSTQLCDLALDKALRALDGV